jgi:hypothetical protein
MAATRTRSVKKILFIGISFVVATDGVCTVQAKIAEFSGCKNMGG